MPYSKLSLVLGCFILGSAAFSGDFCSAKVPAAVLYGAPSVLAPRLFVVSRGYPAEMIVRQGKWVRLRDQQGHLAWAVAAEWSDHASTVVVTSDGAVVRLRPNLDAPAVATAAPQVWFERVRGQASEESPPGWLLVRHPTGLQGWIRIADVWGA